MSNQTEDGWYPECCECESGNLGKVYCEDCYKDALKEQIKRFRKWAEKEGVLITEMGLEKEIKELKEANEK